MSWRVVVYGLAGVVVFDVAAVLLWMAAVDVKTRSSRRNADRPICGDDTWLRFERSQWKQPEETK